MDISIFGFIMGLVATHLYSIKRDFADGIRFRTMPSQVLNENSSSQAQICYPVASLLPSLALHQPGDVCRSSLQPTLLPLRTAAATAACVRYPHRIGLCRGSFRRRRRVRRAPWYA